MNEYQKELSERMYEGPPCGRCDTLSYSYARQTGSIAVLRAAGWIEFAANNGFYRKCSDCAAKKPSTYEWIAQIPQVDFEKFMDEHPHVFALEDLKPLVPLANFPSGPAWDLISLQEEMDKILDQVAENSAHFGAWPAKPEKKGFEFL